LKDQGVEGDNTVRYIAAFVDLSGDGIKELIIHVTGQGSCGTGGCPTLVLMQTGSSLRIVSRIAITRPPIRVLDKKSHGWHELAVWVQGGGIQPGYEAEVPFDGESYASNPTVPPAHRLTVNGKGKVVIADGATGLPLD
jgi:hypothetical protein